MSKHIGLFWQAKYKKIAKPAGLRLICFAMGFNWSSQICKTKKNHHNNKTDHVSSSILQYSTTELGRHGCNGKDALYYINDAVQ